MDQLRDELLTLHKDRDTSNDDIQSAGFCSARERGGGREKLVVHVNQISIKSPRFTRGKKVFLFLPPPNQPVVIVKRGL